ncbi:MAG: transposase [Pyrinomonadaceae bacterium]|nr:transposase [Pyrinomonadaceae bacterium]
MAKKWSNRNLPGALHFVTGNVRNRLPIFRQEAACRAFMGELQNLKTKRECKLIALVVMPDHFHLIVNPRDGEIREWTGALKSLAAKRLVGIAPESWFLKNETEHQVWQESFKALPLWSNWMIWQKINYIHNNPLKAGLVNSAKDYQWSSFCSFYKMEAEEILQVDEDWWWADDVQKLERSMAEWEKELEEKRMK